MYMSVSHGSYLYCAKKELKHEKWSYRQVMGATKIGCLIMHIHVSLCQGFPPSISLAQMFQEKWLFIYRQDFPLEHKLVSSLGLIHLS